MVKYNSDYYNDFLDTDNFKDDEEDEEDDTN